MVVAVVIVVVDNVAVVAVALDTSIYINNSRKINLSCRTRGVMSMSAQR
jgi:hypothetical protein